MTRRLSFLLGALAALCVALLLPPDTLLPGASADVTCSTVAMSCSAGGTFTGGTITTPILAPDGSASAPSYAFSSAPTRGMYYAGGNMIFAANSVPQVALGASALALRFDEAFGWTSGDAYGTAFDVILYRDAANTLALRNSTNAQTFNWYYSYTDASNYQRGALKTSASGIEIAAETAGSGADNLDITLTPAGAGSLRLIANTLIQGHTMPLGTDTYDLGLIGTYDWRSLGLTRSIQGSKTKTLTDAAAAVAVTRIAVATNSFMGGEAIWTATSTDGTDQRTLQGKIRFAGVDKAGTVTCAAPQVIGTDLEASTNGNHLTCTWSSATSTTNCDLLATCTDDTAGSQTITMNVRLDMPLPNTVTPQ